MRFIKFSFESYCFVNLIWILLYPTQSIPTVAQFEFRCSHYCSVRLTIPSLFISRCYGNLSIQLNFWKFLHGNGQITLYARHSSTITLKGVNHKETCGRKMWVFICYPLKQEFCSIHSQWVSIKMIEFWGHNWVKQHSHKLKCAILQFLCHWYRNYGHTSVTKPTVTLVVSCLFHGLFLSLS